MLQETLRWNLDEMSNKLDITIEMGAIDKSEVVVSDASTTNDKKSRSSYLHAIEKKETMKASVSTSLINGINTFPKAILELLFNM